MTYDWNVKYKFAKPTIDERRPALLQQLRAMTVTGELKNPIVIEYEGYGDSGGIESKPDNLPDEAEDLLWDLLMSNESGFENNDGGRGEISWDLVEDTIVINHTNFYTESNSVEYEF